MLVQEDKRVVGDMCKPAIGVMVQSLLNVMRGRGAFSKREAEVVFLTESNAEDFLSGVEEEQQGEDISLDELLRECLQSPELKAVI